MSRAFYPSGARSLHAATLSCCKAAKYPHDAGEKPEGERCEKACPHKGLRCANCGAALHGEFCHGCGQSIHGVIKPIHGLLEDMMDIVLHVDGRVVHTLPPLLLKPGFLTLEYFSGRRVRYVAPFRLMRIEAPQQVANIQTKPHVAG